MEKRTVLILGAGASKPYGFPSGPGLVDKIVNEFPGLSEKLGKSRRQQILVDHAKGFVQVLKKSRRLSIDTFLEYHENYRDTGKVAIAGILLPIETEKNLYDNVEKGQDWYRHICNWLMDCPLSNFPRHPISIITYNYDRSLEHCLHEALENSYDISSQVAATHMKKIPIIHIHGQLGFLPWQEGIGCRIGYTGNTDDTYLGHIVNASKSIRIIFENTEDTDSAIAAAREELKKAKAVIFMGFGYDEVNLKRLNLARTIHGNVPIVGTSLGLEEPQKTAKEKLLKELSGSVDGRLVKLLPFQSLHFIRSTEWLQ